MWQDQHHSAGPIDNSKSVSGCPSGHLQAKTYPHGLSSHTAITHSEGHQWENVKGQQDVSLPRDPSSPTCMKGSDSQSFYESGRTDSGFLSGANLSSESQSVEIISSSSRRLEDPNTSMKLDSGVDLGLPEQFNSLSLNNTSLNDLNVSSKLHTRGSLDYSSNINLTPSPTSKSPPQSAEKFEQPVQSWELYYQQDEDGDTQLHIATMTKFVEIVDILIKVVPQQHYLDIVNRHCQTPLHLAVLTGQHINVRKLVVAGADQYKRDCDGNTPLHLACQTGNIDCVKALIEPVKVHETIEANLRYIPCLQPLPPNFEERNYDGQMCVHLATLGGHVDVLRQIMWSGADINAREGKGGRAPLHYALEYGIENVINFLLTEDALKFLDLETPTYAGYTAYQLAACLNSSFRSKLVANGATPRYVPDDDDESDSEYSDEEMYGITCDNYFTRINGELINISA